MSARFIFVFLLITGTYLVVKATMIMYTKAPETKKDRQRELDMILEREILKSKANVQQVDNEDVLDFQFKQKPSDIYANMFDRDPFRIGL